MESSGGWQSLTAMVGAGAALVGAPLTMIVFYLRAIREEHRATLSAVQRRIERLDDDVRRVDGDIAGVRRDFAPKEDWLRETMAARRQLDRLHELLARLQADLESTRGLAAHFARATRALVELADRLAGRPASQT